MVYKIQHTTPCSDLILFTHTHTKCLLEIHLHRFENCINCTLLLCNLFLNSKWYRWRQMPEDLMSHHFFNARKLGQKCRLFILCLCVCVCAHACVCVCAHMHARVFVCAHMHVCMCAHACMCVCVSVIFQLNSLTQLMNVITLDVTHTSRILISCM